MGYRKRECFERFGNLVDGNDDCSSSKILSLISEVRNEHIEATNSRRYNESMNFDMQNSVTYGTYVARGRRGYMEGTKVVDRESEVAHVVLTETQDFHGVDASMWNASEFRSTVKTGAGLP